MGSVLHVMSPCSTPMADFMIDVDDGIKVTAGAYQNAENQSDEDPADRSPSSTAMNACYRIQIEKANASNMRLSPFSVPSASNSNGSVQPMSFGYAFQETMGGPSQLRDRGEFEVFGVSSTDEGVTPSQSPREHPPDESQ